MMNLVNRIKAYVMDSDFLKSVSVLFSGNLIANIISFLSIPIISRIYSKDAFGDYSIVTSVAAIIIVCSSFGLSSAIMAPKDNTESKQILTTTFLIQLFIISLILFISLVLYLFDIRIYDFSGQYILSLFLLWMYSIAYALFSVLSVYTNKLKKNRVLFWNALINSFSLLCFTIPLGVLGWGGVGLLTAAIVSYLIADMQMILKTKPFTTFILKSDVKIIFSKYRDFVLYQFPSNILGSFTIQLPNQAFSRLFGNASLGGYAMCEKILGVPMRLIGSPINTVYFRQASIYVKAGRDLSAFTYKLVTRILLISIIPVIITLMFAKQVFTYILGDEWEIVGIIVSFLIVPYVLTFCSNCISYCLVVIDKQKYNLILTFCQFFLIFLFIFVGAFYFKSFEGTLKLYAFSLIMYHVINLGTIFYLLKRHFVRFLTILMAYLAIFLLFFIIYNGLSQILYV